MTYAADMKINFENKTDKRIYRNYTIKGAPRQIDAVETPQSGNYCIKEVKVWHYYTPENSATLELDFCSGEKTLVVDEDKNGNLKLYEKKDDSLRSTFSD